MSGIGGRFCGRDPMSYRGSPYLLYEFVEASPLFKRDPKGRSTEHCEKDRTRMLDNCQEEADICLEENLLDPWHDSAPGDPSVEISPCFAKYLGCRVRAGFAYLACIEKARQREFERRIAPPNFGVDCRREPAKGWDGKKLPEYPPVISTAACRVTLFVGGCVVIVCTLAEDLSGVGIADDPVTIPIGGSMIGKACGAW